MLAGLLLFGCKGDEPLPDYVLTKPVMVSVLTDMHELEAQITDLRLLKDSAAALFREEEQKIFERHHIDDSIYYESYEYYLAHRLKDLESIYAAVVDSLTLRRNMVVNPPSKSTDNAK